MYDRALRIGRIGYEVQTRLCVATRHVVFDRTAKKLGTKLDLSECSPMPEHWGWVADPTEGSFYLPDHATPTGPMYRYFVDDHHERFADSVGYRSYRTWPDSKRVFFQLELISEPLPQVYDRRRFLDDARRIYEENLAEMLDLGVVAQFPGGSGDGQQDVSEQVNLEIDHVDWPERVDPLHKLAWLAIGLWAMCRWRAQLRVEPHWALLLDTLEERLAENASLVLRYDLLANVRLLLDAWFTGAVDALTWRWLHTMLTSRAHLALLMAAWDNRYCTWYVHGVARLTFDELSRVSPRVFELWRSLGIDSVFPDLFADEPVEHIRADLHQKMSPEYLRQGLDLFCPRDRIVRTVRSAIWGDGRPEDDAVVLPLFHLRKTLSAGATYLELRDIDGIKKKKHARYPHAYKPIETAKGEVQVVAIRHLHTLGTDLAELLERATAAGRVLWNDLRDSDPTWRRADARGLERRTVPLLQHLFDAYRRPLWVSPIQPTSTGL